MNNNTQNGLVASPAQVSVDLKSAPINPEHLKEWVEGSGVDEELTRLNIESISGEEVFARLYPHAKRLNGGRLDSSFLKKHEKCMESSGWWVEPIDPTLGTAMSWGQFKADTRSPLSDVKYRGVAGEPTHPLCLKVPPRIASEIAKRAGLEYDPSQEFWQWFISQKSLPLIITEGAKKAGCLLTNYIPTVALPGVWNAYLTLPTEGGEIQLLHPFLEALCEGREVYILFDTDPKPQTRKDVKKAKKRLGLTINQAVATRTISLLQIPAPFGKKMGIDDFLIEGGELSLLFDRAIELKDWLNPAKSGDWKIQVQQMTSISNGQLRLNQLTNEVELDGVSVDWNTFVVDYAQQIDSHTYGKERFNTLAVATAKKFSYHPVRDYFDSLTQSDYNLDDVAVKYFGAEPGSLQCRMIRKWLISAVARVYEPGCKADSALILYDGKGGIGKSTWFKTLCADPTWFCDDMGSPEDKDQLLKMHQHWIIEWAELDCILGFKNDSAIKSAISCAADNIRPPYGRSTVKMKRRSILCGTTNRRK